MLLHTASFVVLLFADVFASASRWKCVFSPQDNASLWVTDRASDIACAGPTWNHCYWFTDQNCSALATSTELVGKLCVGTRRPAWCRLASELAEPGTTTGGPDTSSSGGPTEIRATIIHRGA